jgi:hypothetical protein
MSTEMFGYFNHRKLFGAKLRIYWHWDGNKHKVSGQKSGAGPGCQKLDLANKARGELAHCELDCWTAVW